MDLIQKDAVKRYSELARSGRDPSLSVGRKDIDRGKDHDIWQDIIEKLNPLPGEAVLDIGCGYGGVTEFCLKESKEKDWKLTLFDIEDVINAINEHLGQSLSEDIELISGVYPYEVEKSFFEKKFDKIILYSVLHYTSNPKEFIRKLVSQLNEGGSLLIGDLPNVNKKGRFLSSSFGRQFEAKYQGIPLSKVKRFESQTEYVSQCTNQNKEICDNFVFWMIETFRKEGLNVFVLPQKTELPYSYTREDVIIHRP